ncbi:isopentenyl-diphosphate Delta-isomerase [Pedobacter sp.]
MTEKVILVDSNDIAIGLMEKMQAHEQAQLHRAFSVFLLNDNNEVLLQQRALSKYHCAGMWTNTCCSHPREGETLQKAVDRRLLEEMGISCKTDWSYSFIYKADVGNGLVEHELDHVFLGRFNEQPQPNTEEVADWKYMSVDELKADMADDPEKYTPWFKIIFNEVTNKGILELV